MLSKLSCPKQHNRHGEVTRCVREGGGRFRVIPELNIPAPDGGNGVASVRSGAIAPLRPIVYFPGVPAPAEKVAAGISEIRE